MKGRLKEFMVHLSVNAADLADKIGVQRSNISHILNGRNLPSSQFIEKLLNAYPELDAGWLLTGKGQMLKSPPAAAIPDEPEKDLFSQPEKRVLPAAKKSQKEIAPESDSRKKIERVVFFYQDKSFVEYYPE